MSTGDHLDIYCIIFSPTCYFFLFFRMYAVFHEVAVGCFPLFLPLLDTSFCELAYVTHLDETSHMSAEFVFRYGPKCMGGFILPILVLLHL